MSVLSATIEPTLTLNNDGITTKYSELYNVFGKEKLAQLFEKLTICSEQKMGPPKIAHMFKYKANSTNTDMIVWLPRTIINQFDKLFNIRNLLKIKKIHKTDIKFIGQLMPNQEVVLQHLMDTVYAEESHNKGLSTTTLNIKAGLGKTFVAAGLISKLSVKTLYITTNKLTSNQAIRDLSISLSCKIETCVSRDIEKIMARNPDVVIMVINSALNANIDFFKQFGLVVYDEIHLYCGIKRNKIFWNNFPYALGLSATTADRKDAFDRLYYKHIGEVIQANELKGWTEINTNFINRLHKIIYKGAPEYTQVVLGAQDKVNALATITQLGEDPERNDYIAELATTLLKDPLRNIFIFVEHIEHIKVLYDLISAKYNDSNNVIYIDADTTKTNLESIKVLRGGMAPTVPDTSRLILTTYGYSGTGLSIVRMNTIIFGTPRRNGYKQICARILRAGSDQSIERHIYDIVDINTPLRGQFDSKDKENNYNSRMLAYKFYNFKLIETKYIASQKNQSSCNDEDNANLYDFED